MLARALGNTATNRRYSRIQLAAAELQQRVARERVGVDPLIVFGPSPRRAHPP
jgi:hypothetical protein